MQVYVNTQLIAGNEYVDKWKRIQFNIFNTMCEKFYEVAH